MRESSRLCFTGGKPSDIICRTPAMHSHSSKLQRVICKSLRGWGLTPCQKTALAPHQWLLNKDEIKPSFRPSFDRDEEITQLFVPPDLWGNISLPRTWMMETNRWQNGAVTVIQSQYLRMISNDDFDRRYLCETLSACALFFSSQFYFYSAFNNGHCHQAATQYSI